MAGSANFIIISASLKAGSWMEISKYTRLQIKKGCAIYFSTALTAHRDDNDNNMWIAQTNNSSVWNLLVYICISNSNKFADISGTE